jgi:hypothetical protein
MENGSRLLARGIGDGAFTTPSAKIEGKLVVLPSIASSGSARSLAKIFGPSRLSRLVALTACHAPRFCDRPCKIFLLHPLRTCFSVAPSYSTQFVAGQPNRGW